jgi:hypothetical protein
MGKHEQIFMENGKSRPMNPSEKKNMELVPTRDEVDQSRRLVEEIRRGKPTNDECNNDKDR